MVQEAPTWKDHLGTIPVGKASLPYAGGTKTMDWQNMEAANKRNAAQIASQEAMFAQEMAYKRQMFELEQWEAQQRWALEWLNHEAYKAANAQVASGGYGQDQFGAAYNDPYAGIRQGNVTTKPLPQLATKPNVAPSSGTINYTKPATPNTQVDFRKYK